MRARVYWYDGRKSVWTQHTTTGCHEAETRDTEWTRLTCTHQGTQRGPEGIQQIWLAIDQWRNHNYNTTKIHHMNQTAILCMSQLVHLLEYNGNSVNSDNYNYTEMRRKNPDWRNIIHTRNTARGVGLQVCPLPQGLPY